MRSLTFTLDTQTGSDAMAPVTVTITEQADGSLVFTASNVGDGDNMIGDLRGLFFDVADDALLGTLSATGADITDVDQSGSVDNLGGGVTSSGSPESPYEVGVEFGTSGISGDDIQTTTFTLSSSLRALTLDDIALQALLVRQTSVGEEGGDRGGSDKLYGFAPYPVDAIDDALVTDEDTSASGNVLANDIDLDAADLDGDGIGDGLTVTSVNGDEAGVGNVIDLGDGVLLQVGADGTYSVDPTSLNWLAEGETQEYAFTYGVNDGNGGSDEATVTVTVNGLNDLPVAEDDLAATDEATAVTGHVLGNDWDPDLSDTLLVSGVNGDAGAVGQWVTLESGALVQLNEDGSYTYDPNGQFDALLTGESATDSFTYEVSDGHGGVDTATVTVTIDGVGESGPNWQDEDHFGTFVNKKGVEQGISNVVLYLRDAEDEIFKVKIDNWDGKVTDLDDVNLGAFLDDNFADADLVAVSIKAGNNHNRDLGPGEGQLFLLDGDEDIDHVAGGPAPEPLTLENLAAKADYTFQYEADLFG